MSMHDVRHGVRLHTLLEGNLGEQGSCGKLMAIAWGPLYEILYRETAGMEVPACQH